MNGFEKNEYKVFDLFKNQWALVAAGTVDHFNACTVGWGSLGTLWSRAGKEGHSVTVYIHPARYTKELLMENDKFTVSFFPEKYKAALGYMGSHTGRKENKAESAGLTPVAMDGSVGFKEATLTFVCRKIYAHQFAREDIAQDIQEHYKANPKAFPVDEKGEWQPHFVFVGEITEVKDER